MSYNSRRRGLKNIAQSDESQPDFNPSSAVSRIMLHVTNLQSTPTGFSTMTMSQLPLSDLSTIAHRMSIKGCTADKSAPTV